MIAASYGRQPPQPRRRLVAAPELRTKDRIDAMHHRSDLTANEWRTVTGSRRRIRMIASLQPHRRRPRPPPKSPDAAKEILQKPMTNAMSGTLGINAIAHRAAIGSVAITQTVRTHQPPRKRLDAASEIPTFRTAKGGWNRVPASTPSAIA